MKWIISLEQLQNSKNDLEQQQIKLKETQEFDEEQLRQGSESSNKLRVRLQETEQLLHQLQDDFHRFNSEHAALIAAQKAARKTKAANKEAIKEWSNKPRLLDILQVEPEWQAVCEMVLNDALNDYVLDDFEELWPQWSACESQGQSILTMRAIHSQQKSYPRLADKIKGTIPATVPNLEHIFTAEHIDEAISWLPHLSEHESIVTVKGFWLGKGWVKLINQGEQDELGLLTRQQKIADLSLVVDELKQKMEEVRAQRDQGHAQLQESLNYIDLYQLNLNSSNEALRANVNALNVNEQSMQHTERLIASMSTEHEELRNLLEELVTEHWDMNEKLGLLEKQSTNYEEQQIHYINEKQIWLDALDLNNKELEETRSVLHQAEMEYDREVTKMQQLTGRITREQERLDVLQERLEHLALLCEQSSTPGAELQEQLAIQLMKHGEVELQLALSREQLTQIKIRS